MSLSLPRALAEEKIISFPRTELFNPDRLTELEQFFKRCELQPVDHSARLTALGREERNLTAAIKDGGDVPALPEALKAVQAERAKLQASIAVKVTPSRHTEPAERRAQHVLRQIEEVETLAGRRCGGYSHATFSWNGIARGSTSSLSSRTARPGCCGIITPTTWRRSRRLRK